MAGAYSLALVGFSEKESATFKSFFRLAARRPPAYVVQDEVVGAQVWVINVDNTQALRQLRFANPLTKVLLIGHSDQGLAGPLLSKPVKLIEVLTALDELVGVRQRPRSAPVPAMPTPTPAPAPAPAESPPGAAADTEFLPTQSMVREGAARTTTRVLRPIVASAQAVGMTRMTDAGAPDVLLVAESLVEGRILRKRFKRYGLNVDWSREATQALAMLQAHPYRLVAIDQLRGDPDAFSVCRSAKQCKQANGRSPVVMMFAPTVGGMDRIKAGLAGCNAYLLRSVGEAEFHKALSQHRLLRLTGSEKTDLVF